MSQRIKEFLYIIWLDESTSHSGRIDTIKLFEYYEKKINSSGGIFNTPLKIKVAFLDHKNFDNDPFKLDQHLIEKYNPTIYNPHGIFRDQEKLDYLAHKNCLFFLKIDPSFKYKLKIPKNCINISTVLFTNSDIFAWTSKVINKKNVYFFYHPEISSNISEYKNKLKKASFKGKLNLISIPEKIGDDYEAAKTIKEKDLIFKNLFRRKDMVLKNESLFFFNIWPPELIKQITNKISSLNNNHTIFSFLGAIENVECLYSNSNLPINLKISQELRNVFPKKNSIQIEFLNSTLQLMDQIIGPINYASKIIKSNEVKLNLDNFTSILVDSLSYLDGKNDFYLGCYPIYFIENSIAPKITNIYQYLGKKRSVSIDHQNFFELQPSFSNQNNEIWYIDIDIIRVTEIDVDKETWSAEIEIEINSTSDDPLKYIFFKNLLNSDYLKNAKLVRSEKTSNKRTQKKYRILEEFVFEADINDFPFDKQILKIEYKIEETLIKKVILQPPMPASADREFIVKGWIIKDVDAGINYYKNFDVLGTKMEKVVRISEFSEVSWYVSRTNIIPAIRSLVPLTILFFLSWYCSFLPFESSSTTVALNTTVFLAGVALYFSADRPNGYSLTMIDKYFIGFYIALGTIILSEFTLFFGEEIYLLTHLAWQILLPIIFIFSLFTFLFKYRIKK